MSPFVFAMTIGGTVAARPSTFRTDELVTFAQRAIVVDGTDRTAHVGPLQNNIQFQKKSRVHGRQVITPINDVTK